MIPNFKKNTVDAAASEDFFAIGKNCVGVGDGVSKWKDWNINCRLFTEQLVTNTISLLHKKLTEPEPDEPNPETL